MWRHHKQTGATAKAASRTPSIWTDALEPNPADSPRTPRPDAPSRTPSSPGFSYTVNYDGPEPDLEQAVDIQRQSPAPQSQQERQSSTESERSSRRRRRRRTTDSPSALTSPIQVRMEPPDPSKWHSPQDLSAADPVPPLPEGDADVRVRTRRVRWSSPREPEAPPPQTEVLRF